MVRTLPWMLYAYAKPLIASSTASTGWKFTSMTVTFTAPTAVLVASETV